MRVLRWFKRLGVRQKVILIVALLLVIGGFGYLAITGKLGIRAISTTKTVIVKGRSVDPSTGQPIVGATISLWTENMRPQPSPVPSPRISPTPTRSATPRLSPTPTPIRGGSPTPTPSPTPRPSASIGLLGMAAPSPSPQPSVKTVTDANGNYQAKIVVDTADPAQNMIWVWQYKKDLPNLAPGSQVALQVPQTNLSTVTLTKNFNIGRPPDWNLGSTSEATQSQDVTTLTVDSECKTDYGEDINGVIFCSKLADNYLFQKYKKTLIAIADQIRFLRTATGLNSIPKSIFLSKTLDWIDWKSYLYDPSTVIPENRKIYLGEEVFMLDPNDPELDPNDDLDQILFIVNVQFGFIVDWERGWQLPSQEERPGCLKTTYLMESHCFSSADDGFTSALEIVGRSAAGLQTGLLSQPFEFAVHFAELFTKSEGHFLEREKLIYAITNFMLMSYEDTTSVEFIAGKGRQAHNAVMFLYKHVANKSKQDEVFPGTIATPDTYEYADIAEGRYMTVGVASLKLYDHANRPMEDTKVNIGGKSVTTRLQKDSGVFSDGSGDSFDITGTGVVLDAVAGVTAIDINSPPPYYQGAVFSPVVKEIILGSNDVIELRYRQIGTRIMVPPPNLVNSCGINPPSDSGCWQGSEFTAKFTAFNGRTAEGIKLGQMSRYPDFGTPGGLSFRTYPNYIVIVMGGDLASVNRVFDRPSGSSFPKAKIQFSRPSNLNFGDVLTVYGRPYQKCTDYTPPNVAACVKYW